ncbi:regulatory LuxR family protein [Murinocardiopsis flavida]|uniref:Regulatory LuxR family protein n=1 Tax=Murinocardiopsis flavida TaxID=645275 RepID=A0A2P8DLP1_9ACTN|nr:LuxR family transcriptional regulator [Murinocardiopsis flavida]PSK98134.1 regulatory LuxR family protein [Murinocardiopsis flavida]
MSTAQTGAGPRRYGRSEAAGLLARSIAAAATGGGSATVVSGPPGSGKTTLLAEAAAMRPGATVLRARGRRAETGIALAGLHALLRPARHRFGDLRPDHGGVLTRALEQGRAGDADGMPLYLATLDLLALLARDGPLLCLIDDCHWMDRRSLALLSFAAHRADDLALCMLFGSRAADLPAELADLPAHALAPMPPEALDAVLLDAFADLDPTVRAELAARAHGNPALAVERARALTPAERAAESPLPLTPAVPDRVMDAYADLLRSLSAGTERLLLLAALEPGVETAAVERLDDCWPDTPWPDAATALGDAGRAGALRAGTDRLECADPVLADAAWQAAAPALRREAHQVMARIMAGQGAQSRALWHRAAASAAGDEALSAELAAAARTSGLAAAEASRLLERSAELTARRGAKASRLTAAAYQAWTAGRPCRSAALVERAVPHMAYVRTVGLADLVDGHLAIRMDDPIAGCDRLLEAARATAPYDRECALHLLLRAADAAALAGDPARHAAASRRAAEVCSPDAALQLRAGVTYATGTQAAFTGDYRAAGGPLRHALDLAEGGDDPVSLVRGIVGALRLGDPARSRRLAERALAAARSSGAASMVPQALAFASYTDFWTVPAPRVAERAELGLRLSRATGQRAYAAHHMAALAMAAALQGDEATCALRAGLVAEHSLPHPLGLPAALAAWAMAFAELSAGRAREAAARLEELASSEPYQGHREIRLLSAPLYVEAAVRIGAKERAAAALAGYERWATSTAGPEQRALLARCRALLSEGAAAHEHFEEAVRLHRSGERGGVEEARTRLAFGSFLRRGRLPSAARPHLRFAAEALARLEMPLLHRQAVQQLRATGGLPEQGTAAPAVLTPQQEQISRLVAEGATNREIARGLHISPRTVEHHLRNIFARLEIRSRVDLARRFG